MAITDAATLDFIGISKESEKVFLAIDDDMAWTYEGLHIEFLQRKLNAYLVFLQSKEIYKAFPKAEGKEIEIRIYLDHSPTLTAKKFFKEARKVSNKRGYELRYIVGKRDENESL